MQNSNCFFILILIVVVVRGAKHRVPGINILTDVICGFPTETELDFEKTLDLVRKYKFASLFINQFFQRPGTPAARMHQIPTQEVSVCLFLFLLLATAVITIFDEHEISRSKCAKYVIIDISFRKRSKTQCFTRVIHFFSNS